MLIFGMESSCDETSAAVVEMSEGIRRIRSNIIASQVETHRLYGGVVPEIAGRAHIEAVSGVAGRALEEAGVSIADIGAVAVTTRPGLIGALLVGVNFAKSLAYANNIPLVPVDHLRAHVAAAYLDDPALGPPHLALVVSGGHTSIYEVTSYTDLRELGSTRDDAAGEAFDKIGRVIGLPYPGGAEMDRLARQGNPFAVTLPSPALAGENFDFSFSGIKTAALNYINRERQRGAEFSREDLAASYTRMIVSALSKKTGEALGRSGMKSLVLAGGVAANSHLRRALSELCARRGVRFVAPPVDLCGDNAAMVAAAGYYAYLAGERAGTDLNASAI